MEVVGGDVCVKLPAEGFNNVYSSSKGIMKAGRVVVSSLNETPDVQKPLRKVSYTPKQKPLTHCQIHCKTTAQFTLISRSKWTISGA